MWYILFVEDDKPMIDIVGGFINRQDAISYASRDKRERSIVFFDGCSTTLLAF